eukprot:m.52457 g.52457  ORF g.52457 m.52457 type:complete len:55 (+) comp12300_c0_seq2:644-808(+)
MYGHRFSRCQVNGLNLHSDLYRCHDQKQPCFVKARDQHRRFYVARIREFWELVF